jgi:hypothetical protein
MSTNTTKETANDEVPTVKETADMAITENSNESSDDNSDESDNESSDDSDNESAIDYGVETTLSEAFNRLRWSVFDHPSKIQVHQDLSRHSPDLLPFHNHPIAGQPATEPPCYKIAFTIEALSYIETPGYKRPRRLMVQRADGNVVTIADVVEQLSPYFNEHREDILWVKAPMLNIPSNSTRYDEEVWDTKFFFEGFSWGVIEDEYYAIGVEVQAEE